ncbi:MAG: DUF2752 domain-containing protein [Firmicutes bacterium]|nr:DUF2752 domain-containing protein [Bacillota bacterium]
MKLLKQDIKNYWLGLTIAVIVCVILDRIFGTCCPMRIITGLPCPACGTTRSLISLAQLDFKTALWYQPVIPLVIVHCLYFSYRRYIMHDTKAKLFNGVLAAIIIIGILAYFYRMYRYFPERPPLEYTNNNLFNILRRVCHGI